MHTGKMIPDLATTVWIPSKQCSVTWKTASGTIKIFSSKWEICTYLLTEIIFYYFTIYYFTFNK